MPATPQAASRRQTGPNMNRITAEPIADQHEIDEVDVLKDQLAEVQALLAKHHLAEDGTRQSMPELRTLLLKLPVVSIALILNALSEEDRLVAWREVSEERRDEILELLSDEVREELVEEGHEPSRRFMINAFWLEQGRLQQKSVVRPSDLAGIAPIWVDLIAPPARVREWIGRHFGLEIPDPESITDLEASARFYIEEDGDVHLRSDFLLDLATESRNVPVAFILHNEILFSIRSEELPVFRLQRHRARARQGYVAGAMDLLLDLYAADAEYSADALEDVYASLESVARSVLSTHMSDEQAGYSLAEIARQEDVNGRIRRNVLDTRRAVSSLMRGKILSTEQNEEARQLLRDIESLDGHTSFLFGKINFLMDAVVGFININQNQRINKLTKLSIIFMPINVLKFNERRELVARQKAAQARFTG